MFDIVNRKEFCDRLAMSACVQYRGSDDVMVSVVRMA